jgi:hypothetical protein
MILFLIVFYPEKILMKIEGYWLFW